MTSHRRPPLPIPLSAAVLLCLTAAGIAQRQGAAPGELPAVPAGPAGHLVQFEDSGVWADSPAYKARIDSSGIHFTPTLGPGAPRNFPVHLAFESMHRGGTALRTGTGEPRLDGDLVTIPRGSDRIVEEYEVRDAAIELRYRFASRPAGQGDLVVRLAVRSELRAPAGERLEELRLERPGIPGGVRIGAVTGIDARGRTRAGHLNYDGEVLELVLPAEFVDGAAYPMVLDPLIGGIFSGGSSFQDRRPDVAYDATNDTYLLVWEITRSAADIDIWGMRLKSDNTGRSGVFVVRTAGIQSGPCIANVASTGMYMVVWQDNSGGNWDLKGVAIQAATNTLSPVVTIAATAADEITPDIAGEVTTSDDDVVVVWDDESVGLRAVEIEVKSPTSVTVGTPTTIAVGQAPLHDNPAISKGGGASRRVVIVWEAFTSSVAAQLFTMDLVPASAPLTLPLSNEFPDVDGDGTDFTVVFQRPEPGAPTLGDVWCWGISAPAVPTAPMTVRAAPRALAATPNDDEGRPTVSFTGSRFVAAWADREPGSTTLYRCHIQNLLLDCSTCGSAFRVTRSTGRHCDWPAIASHFSGGRTGSDQAWVLYQEENVAATPPTSIVMVARYDTVGGGPVTTVANGCGGGGTLNIDGAFAFGERVTFRLTGADPAAGAGILVAGTPQARTQFPCGPCQILLGPVMVGVPLNNGGTSLSSTIPCDQLLLNFDLDVQIVALGTTTSPCGIIPGIGTSAILRARVRD